MADDNGNGGPTLPPPGHPPPGPSASNPRTGEAAAFARLAKALEDAAAACRELTAMKNQL